MLEIGDFIRENFKVKESDSGMMRYFLELTQKVEAQRAQRKKKKEPQTERKVYEENKPKTSARMFNEQIEDFLSKGSSTRKGGSKRNSDFILSSPASQPFFPSLRSPMNPQRSIKPEKDGTSFTGNPFFIGSKKEKFILKLDDSENGYEFPQMKRKPKGRMAQSSSTKARKGKENPKVGSPDPQDFLLTSCDPALMKNPKDLWSKTFYPKGEERILERKGSTYRLHDHPQIQNKTHRKELSLASEPMTTQRVGLAIDSEHMANNLTMLHYYNSRINSNANKEGVKAEMKQIESGIDQVPFSAKDLILDENIKEFQELFNFTSLYDNKFKNTQKNSKSFLKETRKIIEHEMRTLGGLKKQNKFLGRILKKGQKEGFNGLSLEDVFRFKEVVNKRLEILYKTKGELKEKYQKERASADTKKTWLILDLRKEDLPPEKSPNSTNLSEIAASQRQLLKSFAQFQTVDNNYSALKSTFNFFGKASSLKNSNESEIENMARSQRETNVNGNGELKERMAKTFQGEIPRGSRQKADMKWREMNQNDHYVNLEGDHVVEVRTTPIQVHSPPARARKQYGNDQMSMNGMEDFKAVEPMEEILEKIHEKARLAQKSRKSKENSSQASKKASRNFTSPRNENQSSLQVGNNGKIGIMGVSSFAASSRGTEQESPPESPRETSQKKENKEEKNNLEKFRLKMQMAVNETGLKNTSQFLRENQRKKTKKMTQNLFMKDLLVGKKEEMRESELAIRASGPSIRGRDEKIDIHKKLTEAFLKDLPFERNPSRLLIGTINIQSNRVMSLPKEEEEEGFKNQAVTLLDFDRNEEALQREKNTIENVEVEEKKEEDEGDLKENGEPKEERKEKEELKKEEKPPAAYTFKSSFNLFSEAPKKKTVIISNKNLSKRDSRLDMNLQNKPISLVVQNNPKSLTNIFAFGERSSNKRLSAWQWQASAENLMEPTEESKKKKTIVVKKEVPDPPANSDKLLESLSLMIDYYPAYFPSEMKKKRQKSPKSKEETKESPVEPSPPKENTKNLRFALENEEKVPVKVQESEAISTKNETKMPRKSRLSLKGFMIPKPPISKAKSIKEMGSKVKTLLRFATKTSSKSKTTTAQNSPLGRPSILQKHKPPRSLFKKQKTKKGKKESDSDATSNNSEHGRRVLLEENEQEALNLAINKTIMTRNSERNRNSQASKRQGIMYKHSKTRKGSVSSSKNHSIEISPEEQKDYIETLQEVDDDFGGTGATIEDIGAKEDEIKRISLDNRLDSPSKKPKKKPKKPNKEMPLSNINEEEEKAKEDQRALQQIQEENKKKEAEKIKREKREKLDKFLRAIEDTVNENLLNQPECEGEIEGFFDSNLLGLLEQNLDQMRFSKKLVVPRIDLDTNLKKNESEQASSSEKQAQKQGKNKRKSRSYFSEIEEGEEPVVISEDQQLLLFSAQEEFFEKMLKKLGRHGVRLMQKGANEQKAKETKKNIVELFEEEKLKILEKLQDLEMKKINDGTFRMQKNFKGLTQGIFKEKEKKDQNEVEISSFSKGISAQSDSVGMEQHQHQNQASQRENEELSLPDQEDSGSEGENEWESESNQNEIKTVIKKNGMKKAEFKPNAKEKHLKTLKTLRQKNPEKLKRLQACLELLD